MLSKRALSVRELSQLQRIYLDNAIQWSFRLLRRSSTAGEIADKACDEIDYASAKPFREVPGPKTYPILKNLPYTLKSAANFRNLYVSLNQLHVDFGRLVRLELPFQNPKLFVHDPVCIRTILKHGVGQFPRRDIFMSGHIYRTQTRKEWFGDNSGILMENGPSWYKVRTKVQKSMMRPKSATFYTDKLDVISEELIARIRSDRDDNMEVSDDFNNLLYRWALEGICLVGFDTKLGCLSVNLSEDSDGQIMIDAAHQSFFLMQLLDYGFIWKYIPTRRWKQFVSTMDQLSRIARKYIDKAAETLQEKNKEDLDENKLSILEKLLLTPGLSKGDACTMALDMISAGIETSGNQMSFFLYQMANNPDIQKKVQAEIDEVIPDKNQPITDQHLNSLPYLKAALKETMRIQPTATGFVRNVERDIVVDGYHIPKNTVTYFPGFILNMDEKYFTEPSRFCPERWLRGHPEENRGDPYAFLPFGHSTRMCIGKRIAEQNLWILATKILKQFNVEYHHDPIQLVSRIVLAASNPLKFRFIER